MGIYVRIGLRPSKLSLKQFEEVQKKLPDVAFGLTMIETKGDKDKKTSLYLQSDSDFFTFEIEQALLRGEIDAAVHSAKDLEPNIPDGLAIAALTKSVSRYDCLASREGFTLDKLPEGSCVGTSSKNRKESLLLYRRDLVAKDIRGNIEERLDQLDKGLFDAIIVAEAALIRLGCQHRISQRIPFDVIEPHPLQGRLAVQIRKDSEDLKSIFGRINEG